MADKMKEISFLHNAELYALARKREVERMFCFLVNHLKHKRVPMTPFLEGIKKMAAEYPLLSQKVKEEVLLLLTQCLEYLLSNKKNFSHFIRYLLRKRGENKSSFPKKHPGKFFEICLCGIDRSNKPQEFLSAMASFHTNGTQGFHTFASE